MPLVKYVLPTTYFDFFYLYGKFLLVACSSTFRLVEDYFSYSQVFRRNFEILVGFDVFQRLFERKDYGRYQFYLVVRTRCPHIGELLRLGNVYYEVVFFGVFAYDLSGVYLLLREDEEPASVL